MRFVAKFAGFFLAACALAGSADRPAHAIDIVAHRAVYDMKLQEGSGRGEVVDVNGTMLFEWEDSCDGWSVTQRTAMTILYQTGDEVDFGWNLVTWESKDGLRYRFFIRRLQNGETTEEFRGQAQLEGVGKGGVAEYSLPTQRTVRLPAGTLFPTAHTLRLLERIEAGESLFWATVFDGSDEAGVFDINAVVARLLATETGATSRSPLLGAGPSWSVNLAIYEHADESAEPMQEQALRLHRNGVVETLALDFGEFKVLESLKDVKRLPSPC